MEMLDDVKILDFTTNVAGPGASAIATDFGAQVIKIESQTGDSARTYAPFIEGKGMTHAWINRGKKSIVMNLKDPRAIEICKQLVKDADVLVEGFRPGVMDRLGLGYEAMKEINPKLVYCSVSAFGQTGPYASRPGFDLLGQAISGMISVNGEKGGHPIKHGVTIADYFAGPNAYSSALVEIGDFIVDVAVDGVSHAHGSHDDTVLELYPVDLDGGIKSVHCFSSIFAYNKISVSLYQSVPLRFLISLMSAGTRLL